MVLSLLGFALLWGNNMNISKKAPVIVSIALLVIWVFVGYISAISRYYLKDSRQFLYTITLKEDVRISDTELAIDAALDGKQYKHSDISAGSEGHINYFYGHSNSYIVDPETNTYRFRVEFYRDGKIIHAHMATGPESQFRSDDISYKKFENSEELITDYNQKVKEAKTDWNIQGWLIILKCIAISVFFSIIFTILCTVANKLKMSPAGFGILCFLYVLLLFTVIFFSSIYLAVV